MAFCVTRFFSAGLFLPTHPYAQALGHPVSLRAPSVIGLVAVLQQQGLTHAQLAAFVAACRARHSGPIVFQVAQGRIRSMEVEPSLPKRRLAHD